MAKISVIIPTYNRATFLPDALESLLRQTRLADEIIVVNDGSTDETARVLADYAPTVTTIHIPNGGRSHARNVGMEAASGDWIALLDDDDRLPADSLELRALFLERHPEAGVVYGDTRKVDADGGPQRQSPQSNPTRPSGNVFAIIACDNLAPLHAHLFRRSLLASSGGFDESLSIGEDWDFWVRLAAITPFVYVPAVVAEYRMHPGMTSRQDRNRMAAASLVVQQRVIAHPRFASLASHDQARIYARLGTRYLRLGDAAAARQQYRLALRQSVRPDYVALYALTVVAGGLLTLERMRWLIAQRDRLRGLNR